MNGIPLLQGQGKTHIPMRPNESKSRGPHQNGVLDRTLLFPETSLSAQRNYLSKPAAVPPNERLQAAVSLKLFCPCVSTSCPEKDKY